MKEPTQSDKRRVVLVFSRHYLPGFRAGGPVRSVSNLVHALRDEFDFRVVCMNRDHGSCQPYENTIPEQWNKVDRINVFYLREDKLSYAFCKTLLLQIRPDLIYLNSFLDKDFSIKPLLAAAYLHLAPVLLCPRGELSDGALALKKYRKNILLKIVRMSGLYNFVNWHATSIAEKQQIRTRLDAPENKIFTAPNLPSIVPSNLHRTREKRAGQLRIVLPARISAMKNTALAIQIAGRVGGEVQLDLWGVIEEKSYWSKCQAEIASHRPTVKVSHRGEIAHDELIKLLPDYDVLLMPSLGENFGHSIIEALGCGLPVVISDRTPWRNLHAYGVGYDLSLADNDKFIHHLRHYQSLDETKMKAVRERCRFFANKWKIENGDSMKYRLILREIMAPTSGFRSIKE